MIIIYALGRLLDPIYILHYRLHTRVYVSVFFSAYANLFSLFPMYSVHHLWFIHAPRHIEYVRILSRAHAHAQHECNNVRAFTCDLWVRKPQQLYNVYYIMIVLHVPDVRVY